MRFLKNHEKFIFFSIFGASTTKIGQNVGKDGFKKRKYQIFDIFIFWPVSADFLKKTAIFSKNSCFSQKIGRNRPKNENIKNLVLAFFKTIFSNILINFGGPSPKNGGEDRFFVIFQKSHLKFAFSQVFYINPYISETSNIHCSTTEIDF